MQHEEILSVFVSASPASRLEVAVCWDAHKGQRVELRRLSWGEGIGWFCQQTLRLNASEAEGLLRTLRASRRKWSERPARGQGKVIPFPVQQAGEGNRARRPPDGRAEGKPLSVSKEGPRREGKKPTTSRV